MNAKICVMALLCHFLSSLAYAQALKVGDKIPDELWELPLQVVNHPEGRDTIRLGEYKDKLIILDFWATWCAPCVKSLEKLDSVHRILEKELVVIPISNEPSKVVMPFLHKREIQLPGVYNGGIMTRYFPHKGIPHQVWIKLGRVYAITGGNYSASDYYEKVIQGQDVKMIPKVEDETFDYEQLFKLPPGILQESGFMGQVNYGVGSTLAIRKFGLIYLNTSIEQLIKAAFRRDYPFVEYENRIIWELPETTKNKMIFPTISYLRTYEEDSLHKEWLKKNTYSYFSRYSEPQLRTNLFRKMQEDISSYLRSIYGIKICIEKRELRCYVLRKVHNSAIPTQGNSVLSYKLGLNSIPLNVFARNLGKYLSTHALPVIDETSSRELINIKLTSSSQDIAELQSELLLSGLELKEETINVDVMVIKIETEKQL